MSAVRDLAAIRLPPRVAPLPERLFRYLLDLEIDRANRLRYCLSVVCLTPDSAHSQPDPELTRAIARIVLNQLRRTDVGSTLAPDVVCLLLVDTEPGMLGRILDRVVSGCPSGARRFVRGSQVVSVSVGASCYPMTAHDRPALLHEASSLMHRARKEGGDRLILPSRHRSSAH